MKSETYNNCLICLTAFVFAAFSASAEDALHHKTLPNGRAFQLSYFQQAVAVTNLDAATEHAFHSMLATNAAGHITFSGLALTNYDYRAVGCIISTNESVPTPFWTNAGGWNNMMMGLQTGFGFFDATSEGDDVLLCYEEELRVFIERLVMRTDGKTVVSRSRQVICPNHSPGGDAITAANFVSSGSAIRVVATGRLPIKEMSWKLDGLNWMLETTSTNASDIVSRARNESQYWVWQDGRWLEKPIK